MNAQLDELLRRNNDISQRVDRMLKKHPVEQLSRKPAPERWSALECIEHLNITARKTFPLIREGIVGMAMLPRTDSSQYKMDLMGRALNWSLRSGSSFKMKTPETFIPASITAPDAVLKEFGGHQEELSELIRFGDGLQLGSVKVISAFNAKVKYNLFSALNIVITHAERHLLQGERALS